MAYPIIVNLQGWPVLVVGGGRVAERKAAHLVKERARVTVVAPELEAGLLGLANKGELRWLDRIFESTDLDGCRLVITATDSGPVNRQVAETARLKGILCNVADAPELGSFTLPASIGRGDLLISVSTGGASPALAQRIKTDLANQYGPEWADYVALLGAIRTRILARGENSNTNRAIFRAVVEVDLMTPLRAGDREELNRRLIACCDLTMDQIEEI